MLKCARFSHMRVAEFPRMWPYSPHCVTLCVIWQADAMKDGGDIFKFMYSHRIGEDTALFYLGWAHVAESSGNFAFAEKVYTKGIAR